MIKITNYKQNNLKNNLDMRTGQKVRSGKIESKKMNSTEIQNNQQRISMWHDISWFLKVLMNMDEPQKQWGHNDVSCI